MPPSDEPIRVAPVPGRGTLARRVWDNGPLLLIVSNLCWAGSIVVGRAAAGLIPPALFSLLRWGGALILVLPLAAPHLRRDAPALWRARWRVLAMGLLGTGLYHVLNYRGLQETTAVNALLMQSAAPLVVLLAAFALYRERPAAMQVAAILLSLAGVVLIVARGDVGALLAVRLNRGDLIILAAVAAYAVYVVMLPRRPAAHPFSFLAAVITGGTAGLLPLSALEYAGGARMVVGPGPVAAVAFSIVFPAFVAYLAFNRGAELVGTARAGQSMHLMPVAGVLLAVLFLGERLYGFHLAGIVLIAAGLWLAGRGRRPG